MSLDGTKAVQALWVLLQMLVMMLVLPVAIISGMSMNPEGLANSCSMLALAASLAFSFWLLGMVFDLGMILLKGALLLIWSLAVRSADGLKNLRYLPALRLTKRVSFVCAPNGPTQLLRHRDA